ncbi:MAG: hypothetical protein ACXITV_00100 [Luteibaculaceae bacterium]
MLYLTFNDSPSGIYKSQVIEVLTLYNNLSSSTIKLVAFIPRQNFFKHRTQIKNWYNNSIIIPILPGLIYWKVSLLFWSVLNLFLAPQKIVARGPIAAFLALNAKRQNQKIVYDGRGAVKAEIEEFRYFKGRLAQQVIEMEQSSVLQADFRIAVSCKLLDYWQTVYDYKGVNHVVIPCLASLPTEFTTAQDKFFETDKPILVYSGSTSPWQSFDLLLDKLDHWLRNTVGKVLLLTRSTRAIEELIQKYPNRVFQKFVPENEVLDYLSRCDYGLLIRHKNITNQVASPVKFAEYLCAGLKVIISENLGDYSQLVVDNNFGFVIDEETEIPLHLSKIGLIEKTQIQFFQQNNLSKQAYSSTYEKVLFFS